MRLHLIYSMRNIYKNSNLERLTQFSSSCRSTEFKNIIPWTISKMIMKNIPVHTRIVIKCEMRRSNPFWVGSWKSIEIEPTRSEFHNEGKSTVEQILESEETNQISRAVRVTVSDSSRKLNHLTKLVRERKIMVDSTKSIGSTRTVYSVPTGCKVLVILSVKQTLPNLVSLLSFPNDTLL